jgi:hypothetical protein
LQVVIEDIDAVVEVVGAEDHVLLAQPQTMLVVQLQPSLREQPPYGGVDVLAGKVTELGVERSLEHGSLGDAILYLSRQADMLFRFEESA